MNPITALCHCDAADCLACKVRRAHPDRVGPLPAARQPLPCAHLGEPTGRQVDCPTCSGSVRLKVRACAAHGECTEGRKAEGLACCVGCRERVAAVPRPPAGEARPGDPPCGVVIGHYRWPALVELQLRLIRRVCGPVPVLVSSDDPPAADRLRDVVQAHPETDLVVSPRRIGHTGGDLAAYWRGLRWARDRGLATLAKLSQRMLITRPRWLQEGAAELAAAGLPLAARRCRGRETFDLRTEAVLLDVAAWSRPEVLSRLVPRRYWHDRPEGLAAETVVHDTLGVLGGLYWPWSLFGEDRYRQWPGVVWHCSHPPAAYHALAATFGVKLDPDFHTEGWQGDVAKGVYRHG